MWINALYFRHPATDHGMYYRAISYHFHRNVEELVMIFSDSFNRWIVNN